MTALEMLSGLHTVLLFWTCIAEERRSMLHVSKTVMMHANANLFA